ncbi:MAG TPA: adenylate/guanylate cyclase domain-containing protein [Leptospiraceae bacterium]|nr:adenylate/guanylate cyclase domain-containing protein [Leptospiraceae bacterium]HMY44069.1 adenylate/guanylate cyclase domain-containing protein [Leptospiraceae bacterium]
MEFLRRHCPYVLFSIPLIVSEVTALICNTAFGALIGSYLLGQPGIYDASAASIVLGLLEVSSFVLSFVFLYPVFIASSRRKRGEEVPASLLKQARTRIYNFPPFLIMLIWGVSFLEFLVTILSPELRKFGHFIPFVSYVLVAVSINAIVIYYLADSLNRFVFFPDWFPDGNFDVTFRLRSPSLGFRFFDLFLVTGIFPVVTILGTFAVSRMQLAWDPDAGRRALIVGVVMGGLYWLLGFVLLVLNSQSFLKPLNSMARAVKDLENAKYETRVQVHSDDQIGNLERAINDMSRAIREKEMIKRVFGHYVSPAVRDMILDGKINRDGDRIEAVVLFSDIRSFTALSEKYEPEKIVKLLNIHFSRVVDVVSKNNGFVDKFIGDAVMAVFDAELTDNMHRLCALKTAAEMLQGVEQTNADLAALGIDPIRIGVGLACGSVIRGNIGSADRREMTVIGDIVNLASRLEAATQELGCPIVATKDTFDESCKEIQLLRILETRSFNVRGRSQPVDVLTMTMHDPA